MNTSVAAYTPKVKTYSTTNILLSRVSIAAGIQILDYYQFWKEAASLFKFKLDHNSITMLQVNNNNNNNKRRVVTASMDGKKRRSKHKYEKLNDAHKNHLDGFKDGSMKLGWLSPPPSGSWKNGSKPSWNFTRYVSMFILPPPLLY